MNTSPAPVSYRYSRTLQVQLIDDVLDVARIITGKLRLSIQPVELSTVVEESVEQLRQGAEEKASS